MQKQKKNLMENIPNYKKNLILLIRMKVFIKGIKTNGLYNSEAKLQ